MMEETCLVEIETARRTLLENCDNLEQIANYCEDNYVQAKDKRGALQETKNFTTQSLASVAYQINTLATSMLQMLDCTASKIGDMDSSMNQINLTIDLNNERISRKTIKSSLMTPKDCSRSYKMIRPESMSSNNTKVKYMSLPIDYGSLDDVGHGIKLGLPSSSPRGSRSGSMRSISSRGSPQGSVRQKSSPGSVRSPLSIPTVPSPTPSTNSLQPPVFTEPVNLDDSSNAYNSIPPPPSPPPPLSHPHPAQASEGDYAVPHSPVSPSMGAGKMSEDRAIPPPSPLPPPPPPEVDGGTSSDDLPPPPRPTTLMLQSPRTTSLSPRSISPNPQQQVSSSPIANGSAHHLHVPGDNQPSPRSPGKSRKATVTRKGSRSPRPVNKPPPPPSAEGHTISPDLSNPLYFSAPAPPPAPAPTPSGGPPTPPSGGAGPPPPPPPPPIGGMGAKKPASSNTQEHSAQAVQKKPPVQATVSFADQLKQRLAKLESRESTGPGEEPGIDTSRDEPNNVQTIDGLPPSTAQTMPGLAADPGPVESEAENLVQTGYTSQKSTEWPPAEYLWKGVALFDYAAMREDEMTFKEGDVIYLVHDFKDGWLVGLCNGVRAMVPGNYVGHDEDYV